MGASVVLLMLSWVVAIAAAVFVEYLGWKKVIVDHELAAGLMLALVAAPAAMGIVQTVLGLPAAGLAALAERDEQPVILD